MRKLEIGTSAAGVSSMHLAPARRLVFGASELAIRVLDGSGKPDQGWVTSVVDPASGCIYACIVTAGVPMEDQVEAPLKEQLLRSFERQGWPEVLTPLPEFIDLPMEVRKVLTSEGIHVDEQLGFLRGPNEIEIVARLIDEAIVGQDEETSLPTADVLEEKVITWLHNTYHSAKHPHFQRIWMSFMSTCCGA